MIRLNLLPEDWKKRERKQLGWIAAMLALMGLFAAVLWGIRDYTREIIPRLEKENLALSEENSELRAAAMELERIDAGADELDAALAAYRARFTQAFAWSGILRNVDAIFAASSAADDLARVELTRVAGHGRTLVLDGTVRAASKEIAMVRVGLLAKEIREYAPEGGGAAMSSLLAEGWPVVKKADWADGDSEGDGGGTEFSIELLFQ